MLECMKPSKYRFCLRRIQDGGYKAAPLLNPYPTGWVDVEVTARENMKLYILHIDIYLYCSDSTGARCSSRTSRMKPRLSYIELIAQQPHPAT